MNTVYLKADWVEPFLAGRTEDGPFTTGDNQTVTVPFMSDREPMIRRFVQLADADAVELPYQGDQLAMWLIVPHDPAGLPAVEEAFDAEALTGLHSAAQYGLVDVTMPKWEQNPAARRPLPMALSSGVLRRRRLRRHRPRHLHHRCAPRRQGDRRTRRAPRRPRSPP